MITQVIWTDVNNRELDTIYARMGDDEIREVRFIICRNDPPEKVEIPAGVSGQFRMIKSSGNFVVRDMTKTALEDGTVIFTVAISDQMVNVQGTGYYDIRLSGGGYLYTASGKFIVDSAVISSGVLEDVSEVNGLVFPDDFLTTEDHFATIDDTITSSSSVWSSYKTNQEITAAVESAKHVYSTNEQVVGKWVNGHDVYEKTFIIPNPTMNTIVNIDMSNLNIDRLLSFNGTYIRVVGSLNFVYKLGSYEDSRIYSWVRYDGSTNYLNYYIQHNSAESIENLYVIVRYTKLS